MRMLILIPMQMPMLLLVLMLMPRVIAETFTCTISLNIKMDWYNMYTLLNMKMNIHFLSPSQGRCCSLLYDCLFLHLRLAVPQN